MASKFITRINFLQQLEKAASNPSATPYSELRRQIWRSRAEYYYRKISGFKQTYANAKIEGKQVFEKVKKPSEWTWEDAASVGIFSAQVIGAFCLGEVVGRNNLVGYDVGNDHGHH